MRAVLHESTRLGYAADSPAGLSVGDALGAQYFMVGRRVDDLLAGMVPHPPRHGLARLPARRSTGSVKLPADS